MEGSSLSSAPYQLYFLLGASFPRLQGQPGFGSRHTAPFSVALINSAYPLLYHISIWGTVELAFTLEGLPVDLKQEEDVQEWEKARVLCPRSCPLFLPLPSAHPAISSTSSASKESHPLPFLLAEAEPTGQVPPFAPPTLCPWLLP